MQGVASTPTPDNARARLEAHFDPSGRDDGTVLERSVVGTARVILGEGGKDALVQVFRGWMQSEGEPRISLAVAACTELPLGQDLVPDLRDLRQKIDTGVIPYSLWDIQCIDRAISHLVTP